MKELILVGTGGIFGALAGSMNGDIIFV